MNDQELLCLLHNSVFHVQPRLGCWFFVLDAPWFATKGYKYLTAMWSYSQFLVAQQTRLGVEKLQFSEGK
jgi:hypothetical protein